MMPGRKRDSQLRLRLSPVEVSLALNGKSNDIYVLRMRADMNPVGTDLVVVSHWPDFVRMRNERTR